MNYGLRALLDLTGRISNVRIAHDIVAREHSVCLVAGNFSRCFLWDSTSNHVPHSGAAKIMEQQSGQSGSFGERVPRSAKVADRLPVSGKEKIFGLLPFPQFRHKQAAFLGECHGTAFSVFRFARIESYGVVEQIHMLATHGQPLPPAPLPLSK